MKNLWNNKKANQYIKSYSKKKISEDFALRIYTTHLLGSEKKLVLHGGGNTSLKETQKDFFKNTINVIHVKGSGWDMSNLNEEGMPTLLLDPLMKTLKLKQMNDDKMVKYLRNNLLNPSSPNPSVETLLHAFLPHKFIDHTHSNAILSLVNLVDSKKILKKLYGKKLGIVPYVMPGFDLAKKCYEVYNQNKDIEGLLLLNHGIFTFAETAKDSYDRMIKFVNIAEAFISKTSIKVNQNKRLNKNQIKIDSLSIQNNFRKFLFDISGNKWILKLNSSKEDVAFSNLNNLQEMFSKGPVTPDHVIRIKAKPLILKDKNYYSNAYLKNALTKYVVDYKKYYNKYKNNIKNSKISDALPRIVVLPGLGYFSIGRDKKEEKISNDIFLSMKESIIDSNCISNFKSINDKEIFKMEYWPLERAKLNSKQRKKFEGSVAIITGGAGKIGSAIAERFLKEKIEVILLDKNFTNLDKEIHNNCFCIKCDLSNNEQVKESVNKVVREFGGIDILINIKIILRILKFLMHYQE